MGKFNIGDKVTTVDNIRAHTSYGVWQVVGFLNGAVLLSTWGQGFDGQINHYDFLDEEKPGSQNWRNDIQRYQESELYTLEEASEAIRRLEATHDQLELDFENAKAKIASNLKQAAALMNEAAEMTIACKKTFESLTQESEALYRAMSKGGWRHSTMACKYGR